MRALKFGAMKKSQVATYRQSRTELLERCLIVGSLVERKYPTY